MINKIGGHYALATSGIWQSSSGDLPHTLHSPISFLSIGLLVAQVPLNSLPVTMYRMLISKNEMPNTVKTINRVVRKDDIDKMVWYKNKLLAPRSYNFTRAT
ncbi:MAG: hypothetical protein ACI9FN_002234 [Saprospiraceae bacterium]|jgi:hypothetical protein